MRMLQLPAFVLSIGFTNQHTAEEYSDLDAITRTTKILRRLRRECFEVEQNCTDFSIIEEIDMDDLRNKVTEIYELLGE
jgi:predicted GNAT family N-acyltransferase